MASKVSPYTHSYRLFPKRIAYEVIQGGIESGELPPCPDGEWNENMTDFTGVPGFLFKNSVIPIVLEMQKLACKLLKSPDGAFFLTSDNPVIASLQKAILKAAERVGVLSKTAAHQRHRWGPS